MTYLFHHLPKGAWNAGWHVQAETAELLMQRWEETVCLLQECAEGMLKVSDAQLG